MPNGENLGALVNALEAFLGFGNRLDRSDPKFHCAGRVKSDADALPAVFHAKQRAGQRSAEAKIFGPLRCFKKAVGLGGSEEIDDRFDADGDGFAKGVLQFQPDLAADLATIRGRAERKTLCQGESRGRSASFGGKLQFVFTNQLSIIGGRQFDLESAAGKSRIFLQIQRFIFGLRAGRVKKQYAKCVARPAVVAEKTLETGFLDESLFVDGR